VIPSFISRPLGAAAISVGWALFAALLGIIALCFAAFAAYRRLVPRYGLEDAAWSMAAVFLVLAAIVGLMVYIRSTRHARAQDDLTAKVADAARAYARDKLPDNVLPAATAALLGGIILGINPQLARVLIDLFDHRPR
jgi:hypothetical protein